MRLGLALTLTLTCAATAHANDRDLGGGLRLHIHLHDVDDSRLPPLQRLTRRAVQDVEGTLQTTMEGDLHVDYVGSAAAFGEVLAAHGGSGAAEPWVAGLALLDRDRVIVHVGGAGLLRTGEVIRHEIAHIAAHAISNEARLPRWYHEGVAMLVGGEATFDRLQGAVGADAFGALDSLSALDGAFHGHRIAVERAYALAAGFVRFSVNRSGQPGALADMHRRLYLGLGFQQAFIATFGLSPAELYAIYARYAGAAGSRWTVALTDGVIWSVVSVLAVVALLLAWWRRPRFAPDGEPLDLEAIAAAGEAALLAERQWRSPRGPVGAEMRQTWPEADSHPDQPIGADDDQILH